MALVGTVPDRREITISPQPNSRCNSCPQLLRHHIPKCRNMVTDGITDPNHCRSKRREGKQAMLVDLPLPHKLLHPNGHTRSYMAKARLIKKARGDAKLAGLAARYIDNQKWPFKRARLSATFYVKHHQDMDEDGLSAWLKPYRDGLADAGIVENDSGFTNAVPVLVKGDKHPRVEIVIEEVK